MVLHRGCLWKHYSKLPSFLVKGNNVLCSSISQVEWAYKSLKSVEDEEGPRGKDKRFVKPLEESFGIFKSAWNMRRLFLYLRFLHVDEISLDSLPPKIVLTILIFLRHAILMSLLFLWSWWQQPQWSEDDDEKHAANEWLEIEKKGIQTTKERREPKV